MRNIACRRLRVLHHDGGIARRRLAARAPRVAEHALRKLGKRREVLIDERVALAAEPAQPVLDVRGVAWLAHFAIIDDVDARLGLLFHDFLHGCRNAHFEGDGVHRYTLLLGEHHPDQVVRPRQTAGVRGQESFGAALHGNLHRTVDAVLRPSGEV